MPFDIINELVQDFDPAGTADQEGMQGELAISVEHLRFAIEGIKGSLPYGQCIVGIRRLAALKNEHVAKGLAGHFDDNLVPVL